VQVHVKFYHCCMCHYDETELLVLPLIVLCVCVKVVHVLNREHQRAHTWWSMTEPHEPSRLNWMDVFMLLRKKWVTCSRISSLSLLLMFYFFLVILAGYCAVAGHAFMKYFGIIWLLVFLQQNFITVFIALYIYMMVVRCLRFVGPLCRHCIFYKFSYLLTVINQRIVSVVVL